MTMNSACAAAAATTAGSSSGQSHRATNNALAALLRERGIPFAFTTGYDDRALPGRFADIPRIEKPFLNHFLGAVLDRLLTSAL